MAFPRPRFFEHDTNVVGVTIERMEEGEPSIYFGRITAPEELPLAELDARLHHFKNAPLDQVPEFWFQEFMTKLPRCLRRLAWWAGLNVSGPMRAEVFGTFGMTTTAAAGGTGQNGNGVNVEAIKRSVMRGQSFPTNLMVAPGINGYMKDLDKRPALLKPDDATAGTWSI